MDNLSSLPDAGSKWVNMQNLHDCSDTDPQENEEKHLPAHGGITILPPEVLETIMAINEAMKDDSYWSKKHDFLVDIAEVFPNFKNLAACKSLWRDRVQSLDVVKMTWGISLTVSSVME